MVPILVNKDVLDPGNDCLKFMIGNRSYVVPTSYIIHIVAFHVYKKIKRIT